MVCKVEACADCIQRCVSIHGKKKNPSPTITSFFKVMIGDQFSKVLYLPPKFARTVSALVDQKIRLEDSSGQRWGVTLSNVNGFFAFQQGWHTFSLDHGLEVGDFLVFNYIIGSHFVVKIYQKTGCEKLDFPEENSNHKKRNRTTRNSVAKGGSCHTIDKCSVDKQGSSTSVVSGSDMEINQSQCDVNGVEKVPVARQNISNCKNSNGRPQPLSNAGYVEEPCFMIDRDLGYKGGEDRSSLFDLSNFEMHKRKSVVDGDDKALVEDRRSQHAELLLRSQTESDLVDKAPVAEEVVGRVVLSDASAFEMLDKNNEAAVMDKMLLSKTKNGDNPDMSSEVIKKCQTAEKWGDAHSGNDEVVMPQKKLLPLVSSGQCVQQISNGTPAFRDFPVAVEMLKLQSAERMKVVKQEQVEMNPGFVGSENMIPKLCGREPNITKGEHDQISNLPVNDNNKLLKVVKTEPVVSICLLVPSAANISCVVPKDDLSFLELPTCLPSSSHKGRMRMDRKIVLLRDPVMRLWPVLCHDRPGFSLFTSGWEAFCKANNIQPGDECAFGVENEPEGIYTVCVVRK